MSQYRTQDWITNIPLYAVNKLYGSAYIQVQKAFKDYFIFAGFPELVNVKQKRQWMNNIFSKILFSDVRDY